MAAVVHPGRALRELADRIGVSPARLVLQAVMLLAGAVALYVLAPEVVAWLSAAPAILQLHWVWLGLMVVTQAGSLVALALLFRALVPRALAFVDVLLVLLTANAAALAVPGGAAVGAAVAGRLFVRSGLKPGDTASALTASGFLSTLTIAALTPVAGALAVLDVRLPRPLAISVLVGTVLGAGVLAASVLLLTTEWPLRLWVAFTRGLDALLLRHLRRPLAVRLADVKRNRRDLRDRLGDNWARALGWASANWLFDFASLALALAAVGADLSLGVALLAFVAAAVLRMIPITPAGLGFVEGGLTSLLTIAGLPALEALVVALAYRAVSFWLPLPAGAVAYVVHRRRHPLPASSRR